MVISNQHLNYINNTIMLNFIRENKIKIPNCKYTKENMVNMINDFSEKNTNNLQLVRSTVNQWLSQGRKKIIYRYIEEDISFRENTLSNIQFINAKFSVNTRLELCDLHIPDNDRELWNLDIITNENIISNINLLFVEKLYKKEKDSDELIDIALPVIVEIDLNEKEIYTKVSTKSDLYRNEDTKVDDIKIAVDILEYVVDRLELNKDISLMQKSDLKSILFEIHNEITELPSEIIATADSSNDDINTFISALTTTIPILDNEVIKEEIFRGVKNVILKHVISMNGDKEIFEKDKYAISTGIDGSGISMSNFRFNAPDCEPIQSNPEYQDIRSIIEPLEQIRKNTLLWNSSKNTEERIRMKMYAHTSGYIQICFEQYVFEEDIRNVLSKVREFKNQR